VTELLVRRTQPRDRAQVRTVLTDAFGNAGVADLADALAVADTSVSLVAERDGAIVGYVALTRGWVDAPSRLVEVRLLGPLAVAPAQQRLGVGRALVERVLLEAANADAPMVFLEGEPTYYPQFGFLRASTLGFTAPSTRIPDEAFQVITLPGYEPSMSGVLVYNDVFWQHDSVGLR
jgi:putative acetyltransferase